MSERIVFSKAASTVQVGADVLPVYDVFFVSPDGSWMARVTTSQAGKQYDSSSGVISPDGTRIAFITMRNREDMGNGNTGELYISDVFDHNGDGQGDNLQRLTSDGVYDDDPAWHPNGKSILFASERQINGQPLSLFSIPATGGAIIPVLESNYSDYSASYSPDGSKIVFIRDFGAGHRSVLLANSDGTNVQNLTTTLSLCARPRWSPDGQHILYTADHHNPISNQTDVYVMDATDANGDGEGDNRVRLTTLSPASRCEQAVWSQDGGKIAFSHNSTGVNEVYIMNADGTGTTQLTVSGVNSIVTDWR
jgi:Tol biopolymer transport system component